MGKEFIRKMMAKGTIWSLKKYQDAVGIILGMIGHHLSDRFSTLGIRFNDGLSRIWRTTSTQFCVYLFKGKLISRPPSFLIQFYRIVKIGLKIFLKEYVWLKIAFKMG